MPRVEPFAAADVADTVVADLPTVDVLRLGLRLGLGLSVSTVQVRDAWRPLMMEIQVVRKSHKTNRNRLPAVSDLAYQYQCVLFLL